jgi:plastocyanin
VALSPSEKAARNAYPIALLDKDDPNAIGTGDPKIRLGPSNGSITNGTTHGGGTIGDPNAFPPDNCGLVQFGQSPCTYHGGDDVESEGGVAGFGPNGPMAVDWQITINAQPGTYAYFCFIHPGMRGQLNVVAPQNAATTQGEINAASHVQFDEDREDAREAELAANVVRFSGGAPGTRTYKVSVGISAAENHVAIDEMLPQQLDLAVGDRIVYQWADPHNVHTVGFPTGPNLPPPFGPDMNDGNEREFIGDPGNAAPGTLLTNPTTLVDAGLHLGEAYEVEPSSQRWSVATGGSTAAGTYAYQCTVHDWMQGLLNVTS